MMNRLFSAILFGTALVVCAACAPASQPATSAPGAAPETPTPTPAPVISAGDTPVPTITLTPRPTSGEIELRFTDPETQEECEAHFPFTIHWGESRTTIDGSGVIDCAFSTQQCGEACVTYHSAYAADAGLSGELLASSADYPHGFLNVGLAGKFSMKQYWTDIPPDAYMAFTEANPAVFESSDILPLVFDFVEGATDEVGGGGAQTFPWKFTLHLK